MFTPLKNRKIERTLTKRINKKVVNTKKQKRKVGGVVVGINPDKDLEDLKKLLENEYPVNAKHLAIKAILKLNLTNINDLMRETIEADILTYVSTIGIEDTEDEPYQEEIKTVLLYLSKKLKNELQNLKDKLNEKEKFTPDIINKIINNLGISDVNDLIHSLQSSIKKWQAEGAVNEKYFTKNQIDELISLKKKLINRQNKLNAKFTKMFSKNISNCIIRELKLTDVYDFCNMTEYDIIYFVMKQGSINPDMKLAIRMLHSEMPGKMRLLDNQFGRFSDFDKKKIIRNLMLFNISDLMYATVEDIEYLKLTPNGKEYLLKLRLDEFKKFLFKKIFKDETKRVEKDKIIDKIISTLGDVYKLMDASDDLIMKIDPSPLPKKLNDELIKLRDKLKQEPWLKPNSSNSNSNRSRTSSGVQITR